MGVLPHRRALGAVAAETERAVEARFLAAPHAVLHFRHDRAPDGAMGADRLAGLDVSGAGGLRLGLSYRVRAPQGRPRHAPAAQPGAQAAPPATEGATGPPPPDKRR